jgi:type IV pilus assembly protein PilE
LFNRRQKGPVADRTGRNRRARGFTLMEIMTACAIIGILAAMALNEFRASVLRAKRTEAWDALTALDAAQLAYYQENDEFASKFSQLAWGVEGGQLISDTTYQGKYYVYTLSRPFEDYYYCMATAGDASGGGGGVFTHDLDNDDFPDVLEVYRDALAENP